MLKGKNKKSEKPITDKMAQMDNAKLFDFIKSQNFESIEELTEFMNKNVVGKRIDKIIPSKKGPKSNQEKSDDLIYEAYKSSQAKGLKLSNEALKLFPENVRALTYIADQEENNEKAALLYKKAADIGAKQLGPEFFEDNKGYFWGMHETRPFMTAKFNYIECLMFLENKDEAIAEMFEMLELNPNDNQGVRYMLSGVLLSKKLYKEYNELHQKYDEESTTWLFNRALYLYIKQGPSAMANKILKDANKANKHVIPIMTGKKAANPNIPDFYRPGDETEAVDYLSSSIEAWHNKPDSLVWLNEFNINKR
jgi:tetratricopeptide (TPR) repeat protein